jgi:hypothetical protein
MFDVFAMSVPTNAWVGLLAAVAGLGAYILLRGDSKLEALKRDAIELSQLCAANGLPNTAGILNDVGVGDISGMVQHVRELKRQLTDEATRKQMLRHFLEVQFEKAINDPARREELLTAIESRLGVVIPRK